MEQLSVKFHHYFSEYTTSTIGFQIMDPMYCAQDVLRCDLCKTPAPPLYCDICHLKLCIPCVGVHLSDQTNEHKVVPFEKRGSTTKCPDHSSKICDLHCENCHVPICSQCVSSGVHLGHKAIEISKFLTSKKNIIGNDLQEIENCIYPKYQEAASNVSVKKADARKHYQKLNTSLKQQGETIHNEIDTVVQTFQSEIDGMESKHMEMIDKQEKAINRTITEIKQIILDLKKMLDTSDVCILSEYKSTNEKFREFPAQFEVSVPTFTPQEIKKEQIYKQLGSLSKLVITTEPHVCPTKTPSTISSPLARPLIDEPRILIDINTDYAEGIGLCSVACLSDSELWTRGEDETMKLYNLVGELLESIPTKSGNTPCDIAVTQSQDLVYTDPNDSTINIAKNSQIQSMIKLRGWLPLNLCNTSSGDILITMVSDDQKQSKVMRYCGSSGKQSIQWDDQGRPLFSSDAEPKYLSENKNFDICVADWTAGRVVVVSAACKLRFIYAGPPSTSCANDSFKPEGITTDSQSRILIADSDNHRIHIVDQDGHFLRYIDNCGLQYPVGLCVDSNDHLFVAEFYTSKVKKIQYST